MHLLQRVERHLRKSGTPQTRFGREAMNDPCFVADLRRGREVGAAAERRVLAYLDSRERTVGA